MSTRHKLHRALLLTLRPFLTGSAPECAEALDALLAWVPPQTLAVRAAADAHEWRDYAQLASDHTSAPKRARTTLGKLSCKMRRCAACGTIGNCAYPYWFKNPVTDEWGQRKPSCV
jgi:hypothetical protein